jgi:carboxy-cis,cis-muconate cyclase
LLLATSSCYLSDDGEFAYSAGGPGARINALTDDGSLGEEVQEMLYVPKEDIEDVNKTRSAVVSPQCQSLQVVY